MLVMRMLWLTPALLGPKSSDVIDTAAENTKPELRLMRAVPSLRAASLPEKASTNMAIGAGTIATASHPVLGKYSFLQRSHVSTLNGSLFSF